MNGKCTTTGVRPGAVRPLANWARIRVAWLFIMLFIGASQRATGQSGALSFGMGVLDALRHESTTEFSVDYRFPNGGAPLQIRLLGTLSIDGSHLLGAGVLYHFKPRGRWDLAIGFTPAFYEPKDGPRLGFALEFLSNIEFSRSLGKGRRIGLSLEHISNGSIAHANPGAETVRLFWLFPLGR